MKKLLTALVCICLMACLMLSPAALVQAAEADNLLGSAWDFEGNDLSLLGTPDGADTDGYYADGPDGTFSIVEDGANGTSYALKISGSAVGNGQWLNGLKSGTEYVVTFWAKIANWGGAAFPNFGVNGYDGDQYVTAATFTEQWAAYSLTFTTGAESTQACVYTWTFGEGAVDFFVDEVVVTEKAAETTTSSEDPTTTSATGDPATTTSENPTTTTGDPTTTTGDPATTTEPVVTEGKNLLPAWDFEDGDLAAVGTPEDDEDGYYAKQDVSLAEGGANGTAYAIKISGANSGNGQWLNDLKSDTEYKVTFWAKIANWGGEAFPNFGVNGYDGAAYVTQDQFTEEWAQYTLTFKTGADSTQACVYTWIFGSGEVDFFVDEVSVVELGVEAPDNPDTGDTNVALYVAAACVALCGALLAVSLKRKEGRHNG